MWFVPFLILAFSDFLFSPPIIIPGTIQAKLLQNFLRLSKIWTESSRVGAMMIATNIFFKFTKFDHLFFCFLECRILNKFQYHMCRSPFWLCGLHLINFETKATNKSRFFQIRLALELKHLFSEANVVLLLFEYEWVVVVQVFLLWMSGIDRYKVCIIGGNEKKIRHT